MKTLKYFLIDSFNICKCRLKMIFRSVPVIVAFIISIIITVCLVNTFLDSAEEKSSIPVGVYDADGTVSSKNVSSNLKELASLYVIEGDYETLERKLIDNDVYVIVQINKGFEKSLAEGDGNKLLTIYYVKGNSNMSMIADIALSQIMDEVCYNSCLSAYKQYEDQYELISDDEFRAHMDYVYDKYDASLSFDFEIVNIDSDKDVSDNISNGILYRLVLIGIISVLISFITLFAANTVIADKRYNTDIRINISYAGVFSKALADIMALFITAQIYVVFSSILLFDRLKITTVHDIAVMLAGLTLFNFATSICFMIITLFIRESVMLQIVGALFVCVAGITGAMEIISVILSPTVKKIADFLPNIYVVRIYNKLTVLGDASEWLKQLLLYSLILVLILYIIIGVKYLILGIGKEDGIKRNE